MIPSSSLVPIIVYAFSPLPPPPRTIRISLLQSDTPPSPLVALNCTHHLVSKHDHSIGNGLPDGIQHPGSLDEKPEWAKALVRNIEEFRRNQDETKTQLKFIMNQILELKTERPIEAPIRETTLPAEASATQGTEGWEDDPQWDATKRGAKPEVTVFDGSLDPKKYMDWEVGLEEYFDWFHLPES